MMIDILEDIFSKTVYFISKVKHLKLHYPELWNEIVFKANELKINNYPEMAFLHYVWYPENFNSIYCKYSGKLRRYRKDQRKLTYCERTCQCFKEQTMIRLNKTYETNMKEIGFKYQISSPLIQEENKRKHKEIYGVEYSAQRPEFQQTILNTNMKKYGKSRASCLREYQEKAIKTRAENDVIFGLINDKESLEYCLQRYSVKELSVILGASHSSVQKAATKFEINFRKRSRTAKSASKYELEILDWLKDLKINFKHNNHTALGRKELDFWFPQHNFAIEFQGTFWHGHESMFKETDIHPITKIPISEIRENDKFKANLCKEKGIDLICIWEFDWKLNKDEIKKQILDKLGLV